MPSGLWVVLLQQSTNMFTTRRYQANPSRPWQSCPFKQKPRVRSLLRMWTVPIPRVLCREWGVHCMCELCRENTVSFCQSWSSSATLFAASLLWPRSEARRWPSRSVLTTGALSVTRSTECLRTSCSDVLNSWCSMSVLFIYWRPDYSWHSVLWMMDFWSGQKQPLAVSWSRLSPEFS